MKIDSKREQLLTALDESSRHISAEREPTRLLQEIVRLAAQLMQFTVGCLFINHTQRKELELVVVYGLPEALVGSRLSPSNGVIGPITKTGKSNVTFEYHKLPEKEDLFKPFSFRTVIGTPLKRGDDVLAVLMIAEVKDTHQFDLSDLDIFERFAAQASIALQTSQMIGKERRRFNQLSILNRLTDYILEAKDLDTILYIVLTGMTAAYGLGFNRAVLLLLDERRKTLNGHIGIGYLNEEDAKLDWEAYNQFGLDDLSRYIDNLEQGKISLTPIDKKIRGLHLDVGADLSDTFSRIVREKHWKVIQNEELNDLPSRFIDMFEPTSPLVIVPIVARGNLLGLLVADNKFTQSTITQEVIDLLLTFANTTALAINNVQLYQQVKAARDAATAVAQVTVLEDLRHVLDSIVRGTQDAINCDAVTLYTYDQERDEFGFPPSMLGVENIEEVLKLGFVPNTSLVYKILMLEEIYKSENTASDFLLRGSFATREGIQSSVGIPLHVGQHKVGVMFINYRSHHQFTVDETTNIELFANQAAIAIHNAQLFERTKRQTAILEGLYEAGKIVTSLLSLDEILQRIAEQAWYLAGRQNAYTIIRLVDSEVAKVVATYPPEKLAQILDKSPEIYLTLGAKHRTGISGRAFETGAPQLVNNVNADKDYVASDLQINSELVVPIKLGAKVIGVINVESPQLGAFDEADEQVLISLSSYAAIAINNAQRFQELMRAKELLASRTALAWMGMVSSTWRHLIGQRALTISDEVALLKNDLLQQVEPKIIDERLDKIELLASNINYAPITAPLGTEEGVSSIVIVELVRKRLKELWTHEPHKNVKLIFDLKPDDTIMVRASPDWLQRALDIILDNAVDAVIEQKQAEVIVDIEESHTYVTILISDNGHGISSDLLPQLFITPISKKAGSKGLGMGLLFARTIVETYGGSIEVRATDSRGTTIAINLPKEQIEYPNIELDELPISGNKPLYNEMGGIDETIKAASPSEYVRLYNNLNQAYEELKELDRKKTEFLSTVSHELRSPLTSIQSCIENFLSGMYGFLNEKQHSRLNVALASVRDESRLIANLLDLARIQEGKTTLDLAPADICKIIHDVVSVFQYDTLQKEIILVEDYLTEKLPQINVDIGKIKGVVTNLIGNALKFTPTGGSITISVKKLDNKVEVKVKDTGIGIAEDEFSKIFERFYQVDSSLTRKVGGTGIGLNIAKEYIEMHDGRIWVESKVGQGSTFAFTIPLPANTLE